MSKQAFMILPKLGVFLLAVASLLVSSHGTDTHLLRGKLQEAASDLEVTTTTGNRKTYIKSPSIGSISVALKTAESTPLAHEYYDGIWVDLS